MGLPRAALHLEEAYSCVTFSRIRNVQHFLKRGDMVEWFARGGGRLSPQDERGRATSGHGVV